MNRKPTWNRRLICVLAFGLVFTGCGKDAPPDSNSPPKLTDTSAEAAVASDNTTAGADNARSCSMTNYWRRAGSRSSMARHSLAGSMRSQADWRVEDGAIVVAQGEKGLLVTTTQFADYILHVEFLCPAGTNSGIFLATSLDPGDVATDCYELNIAGADNPFPTGSLVNRQAVKEDLNRSQWQTYEVHVQSGHIVVYLDEKKVLDYTDPKPLRRGRIGLQLNQGRVAFRNIRLRPLGLESIFNGQDLSGWKSYPEMPSKFTVTADGNLNVAERHVGNWRRSGSMATSCCNSSASATRPGLNSGIFFRCVPGEEMNGYESQIHNGFKNGDRNQPVDCGTGGIFRRVNARRVVADDLKWFYKTIIADGPHVAVWVNGYQVTDWTDTRPADPNPRKGLRRRAGHDHDSRSRSDDEPLVPPAARRGAAEEIGGRRSKE